MRKIIGGVLLALGAFLLVIGLLASFWAPGQVKKTPLDVDTTTRLSGTADKLDPSTGDLESIDVKATSVTQADSKRSTDDVIVWVNTTCLVIDTGDTPDCVDADDPQKRLVNASTDVFATGRNDAMAVNGKYLPAGSEEKEGLVNKFPFGTEKKTYPYWDGLMGAPVEAVYDSTESLDGLETYKFTISVDRVPAEVVDTVDGFYTTEKEIWVEPNTGSIVDQSQHEVRALEDASVVLDLNLSFTDEQVAEGVADGKAGASKLKLITVTLPLIGYIGGVLALLAGALLLLLGRRRETT